MTKVLKLQWRDIPNYPDLQVREDGMAVRRVKSSDRSLQKSPKFNNYNIKKDAFGRAYIKKRTNGVDQVLFVDELVALSFCPQKSGCPYIAHKDFDIENNHYINLEWVNSNDYFSKYHQNRIKVEYGETFAWWKNNWYISVQEEKPKPKKRRVEEALDEESLAERDAYFTEVLERSMQVDKLYLNPRLTLGDLAAAVGSNRSYLSDYINRQGKTFYDFVNEYRVAEACRILDGSMSEENVSMPDVALRSGFNSLSSFYRYFSKLKGVTPTKYQDD